MFLIVITPLVVIGFIVVKNLIPTATCFDNTRNQNETGIDCGGPCVSCEFKNPKAINVFWARAVPVRENSYDVAADIGNPNSFLSSVDVEYEFALYDKFGPITKRTGKTFLYAREHTLVIEPGITTARTAERTEFRIVSVKWQEKPDLAPTIIAERREYSVVQDHGQKQGVADIALFNQSPYDFIKAEVYVAVLDKDGNLLGVSKIEVENLISQSRRSIKAVWPQAFTTNVAVINVQTRVDTFDSHTIVKPQ